MDLICIISEKSELRTFSGAKGEITVMDVVLKSGSDVIQASCFDELAKKIDEGKLPKQGLYKATVAFSLRRGEKGAFQACRLERMDLLYNYEGMF